MAFTVPDTGTASSLLQSILFQEYLEALHAGIDGTDSVINGCAVTEQGTPDMTVAVAMGAVLLAGSIVAVAAGNGTVTTAHASNPRLDLVVIDSAGAIAVRAGTAAAAPKPAVKTAGDVVLAVVYVPANATEITSGQIVDMRVLRENFPIVVNKSFTDVTFSNTTASQTYFTFTIPRGLMNNRVLRVICGGTYLSNGTSSPVWFVGTRFGIADRFVDQTANTTADADPGTWFIQFHIICDASNNQRYNGYVIFQTPGAKTAPTTGISGDMAVVTTVCTPFSGSVTGADVNASDFLVRVNMTMSSAHANISTTCTFGFAVLI